MIYYWHIGCAKVKGRVKMRHAYLLIVHNDWDQLKKLIQQLDVVNHDIYVHIDKKSKDFPWAEFEGIANYSKVCFFQEYEVYWGGYSMVQSELLLFEKAYEHQYDYYHVLSGADLPLKSNSEIDIFFEKNNGKQFIQFNDQKLMNDPEIARRTKYYHVLQNYRRRFRQKWKNAFFTFCERILLVMQILFRINRIKNLDWTIKYGSQWVSITGEMVGVLLKQRDKIEKVFSWTNCADELFIQTVAYNCGFKDQIYQPVLGEEANMRFIDWSRGKNGNPYTFTLADISLLKNNKNLFARKFSGRIDNEVIDVLYRNLQKQSETETIPKKL